MLTSTACSLIYFVYLYKVYEDHSYKFQDLGRHAYTVLHSFWNSYMTNVEKMLLFWYLNVQYIIMKNWHVQKAWNNLKLFSLFVWYANQICRYNAK